MKRIQNIIIFIITLKSWAFAYDFKMANLEGDILCYKILSDSTIALAPDTIVEFWNTQTPNYTNIKNSELHIPEKVTYNNIEYTVSTILNHALANVRHIKSVFIPKTIINMGLFGDEEALALAYYNSITEYVVDNDNPQYMTNNGVLYSKDGKKLISYPFCKTDSLFQVPNGVTDIGTLAFLTNSLKIVEMPLSLKSVQMAAFMSGSIEEIVFQDSLQTIDAFAFSGLSELKHLVLGNMLTTATFAYLARLRPVTVECRTIVPPICILAEEQNDYIEASVLLVPRSSVAAYQQAEGWIKFGTILPIEPPIVTGTDNATVSWVQNFSATGYMWHLYSDEEHTELVMSLIFDERGYLTELILGTGMPSQAAEHNRALAPQRSTESSDEEDGNERRFAEYYSFTIRSLSPNRQYYYVRQSLAGEEVIDEEQGSFETLTDTETGLDNGNTTTDLTPTTATKRLQDGQVLIVSPEGKTYTPDGKELF